MESSYELYAVPQERTVPVVASATARDGLRIAVVTNLPTHYRRPLFALLAGKHDVDFYFTSAGGEDWWLPEHELHADSLASRRASPRGVLFFSLWRGNYDCVIVSLVGRLSLLAAVLATKLSGKPLILWVGIWQHPTTAFHRFSRPAVRWLYRTANAVLVYGPHVAEHVARESGRTDRVHEVRQAVDTAQFANVARDDEITSLRSDLSIGDAKSVGLFIGRLADEKGLDLLLESFSDIAEDGEVLVLAGSGPAESSLRRRAEALGLVGVRFVGYVPQAELPSYLAAADYLVLPSITTPTFREPWGLVVNEAMAAGLPVLATDSVGAVPGGLVVHGLTGLVTREGDRAGLSSAIALLAREPKLRKQLGDAAREHVRGWNYDVALDAMDRAIEEVTAKCTSS